MCEDIKGKINAKRDTLDKMIESDEDAGEILKPSMELDELISEYISRK